MHDYLMNIGFSDKEATVYLALLSVVHMSHLELSRTTGIKRSTVYTIIDSLKEKQMVREVPYGKKVHYGAVDPQRLASFVTEKRALLEEQYHALDDVIPRLRSKAHAGNIGMAIKRYDNEDEAVEQYFEVCSQTTAKKRYLSIHTEIFSLLSVGHQKMLRSEYPDLRVIETGARIGIAIASPSVLIHTITSQHDAVVVMSVDFAKHMLTIHKGTDVSV